MLEILGRFLQVKKIIALMLTITFVVLALRGSVTSTEFMTIFSVIIAFYYGQSSVRQGIKENTNLNKGDE